MSFVFRRGPARLVALASAGALLHTLAVGHVAAQVPPPAPTVPSGTLPTGMRSTLEDESDLAARLGAPPGLGATGGGGARSGGAPAPPAADTAVAHRDAHRPGADLWHHPRLRQH